MHVPQSHFDKIKPGNEPQVRRDGLTALSNLTINNSICSDFHEIEGAVETLKEVIVDGEKEFRDLAHFTLAKMGFKEYDYSRDEVCRPPPSLCVDSTQAAAADHAPAISVPSLAPAPPRPEVAVATTPETLNQAAPGQRLNLNRA